MDYLKSIQISQEDAITAVDARVAAELTRLAGADASIAAAIADQTNQLAALISAPERLRWARDLEASLSQVMDQSSTGLDTDFDRLSDDSEVEINRISELAFARVGTDVTPTLKSAADRLILVLDLENPFSTTDTGESSRGGGRVGESPPWQL